MKNAFICDKPDEANKKERKMSKILFSMIKKKLSRVTGRVQVEKWTGEFL